MGLIYDYSKIREEYNSIEDDKRVLPEPSDVDFEEAYMTLELMIREILGISSSEGLDDGQSWEDAINEVKTLISQAKIYDQAGFYIGKPSAGQKIFSIIAVRTFLIPENFNGSKAKVSVAPSSTAVFSILKNGFEIGTITFEAGVLQGEFSGEETIFEPGDVLVITAPDPQDETLEDPCWNLKLTWG